MRFYEREEEVESALVQRILRASQGPSAVEKERDAEILIFDDGFP
jgi:hypothetical protein